MTDQNATPDLSTKAEQLKGMIDELCQCAPAAAKEAACQVRDKAVAASRQVAETVKKHPFETAAVAVGTGLLVWWLVSRHRNAA